jgi:hypothetical protein
MGLTFIHTSDWHLGRSYQRIGPKSAETRQWRFEAARSVFRLAIDQDAAFILVAGDLFDSETPPPATVTEIVDLLRDAPRPILIIPGNHDPLLEGSVWRREDFAGQLKGVKNVRIALERAPMEFPEAGAVVFPCPVDARNCPVDLTDWIPLAARGTGFRIGLAHGFWQTYNGETKHQNFIGADRAEALGLDYLALGDFHSYTPETFPAAQARSYYSGTIECTAVDEERPGHALVVRIERPGANPEVINARVGRMQPVNLGARQFSPQSGFDDFRSKVQAVPEPSDVLLGATLAGTLSQPQMQEFREWRNTLHERFLAVSLDERGLFPEPMPADFDALALDASERNVLELLERPESLSPALEGQDDADLFRQLATRPEVRREAIALYYQFLRQEGVA